MVDIPKPRPSSSPGELISIERHMKIFHDGMTLVERSANYLDGEGRRAMKALSPAVAVLYAVESIRLTTRLMIIGSWLLERYASKQETGQSLESRIAKLDLRRQSEASHMFSELPVGLRTLIDESYVLAARAVQMDTKQSQHGSEVEQSDTPVAKPVARLRIAYSNAQPTKTPRRKA